MPVVIDEVQVEAVERQAEAREGGAGQGGQKPASGKPKIDPVELAAILRRQEARSARLWAD